SPWRLPPAAVLLDGRWWLDIPPEESAISIFPHHSGHRQLRWPGSFLTRDGFKERLMADTAAGVLIDTIHDWGGDVIFGLPGDGINGIMEALRTRQDKIRFVQVRHEEAAALMACGYAKFTGKLGVCLATSGPGGIHLLNGLYDAALDGQPVLAITGLTYHDLIGTRTQQDV